MNPTAVVLGVAQDGGHPHIGCHRPCCAQATTRHIPACLGLIDGAHRFMIDATPALPEQLRQLHALTHTSPPHLDGLLLTHAHAGHYTGLLYLGREGLGVRNLPTYVMPRMADFLASAPPWNALIEQGRLDLRILTAEVEVSLTESLHVRPIEVPHRDEYTETVGFIVRGPTQRILYLPDIDAWDDWSPGLEATLESVDVGFIDGTFLDDDELDRDMSEVPHPRAAHTMARLAHSPLRHKVRFIHLNHTNPLLDPASAESRSAEKAGFGIARRGEHTPL